MNCFKTTDSNKWIENKNEVANQCSIVQYIDEISFERIFHENSVEDTVSYGKQFQFLKQANVTKVEIFGHNKTMCLDSSVFWSIM